MSDKLWTIEGGRFGFSIETSSDDEEHPDALQVGLPHSCDRWSIAPHGGQGYTWTDLPSAIEELAEFIGEAQRVLIELQHRQVELDEARDAHFDGIAEDRAAERRGY